MCPLLSGSFTVALIAVKEVIILFRGTHGNNKQTNKKVHHVKNMPQFWEKKNGTAMTFSSTLKNMLA